MTPDERKKRRVLYRGGKRGDQVKAVLDPKAKAVIVYHRDADGIERKKFFPATRDGQTDAKAWAEAYHQERTRIEAAKRAPVVETPPVTHRQLWTAYEDSPGFQDLRLKTKVGYRYRWGKWERFRGADTPVDHTTLLHTDQFISAARQAGMAMNQSREVLNVARIVYNWGQGRKLVRTNDLALYRWRQPKDAVVVSPAEYSDEEFTKLLKVFQPGQPDARRALHDWRPWVALMLIGHHGMRANAVLHLRWEDIDLENDRITWPAVWQKQGKAVSQPIGWATYSALLVARRRWELAREEFGIEPPWVLFALNDKTQAYSYQSLHYQLTQAEQRAGVPHLPFRALHGGRRMVVSEITERTGDRMLGLEYVGDTDPKMARKYDKRMQQRIDNAGEVLNERRVGKPPVLVPTDAETKE